MSEYVPNYSDYAQQVNYYAQKQQEAGLKYRLDGDDIISAAADELRGATFDKEGKKIIIPENRLLNELGVQRACFFLRGAVNKVNHLTKYENVERVNEQMRSTMIAFIKELTLNIYNWRPEGKRKITDRRLILHVLETKAYQSYLRGTEGFEAQITGKNWGVTEVYDYSPKSENAQDRIRRFFGGGER